MNTDSDRGMDIKLVRAISSVMRGQRWGDWGRWSTTSLARSSAQSAAAAGRSCIRLRSGASAPGPPPSRYAPVSLWRKNTRTKSEHHESKILYGVSTTICYLTDKVFHHLGGVVRCCSDTQKLLSPSYGGIVDGLNVNVVPAHHDVTHLCVFLSIRHLDNKLKLFNTHPYLD